MKQSLFVYNTLTRKKEEFIPLNAPHVGLYVCGPTVYSDVHLGNCRTYISFDLIVRYLNHLGYKVRYVRNITDAGHLEDDSDTGEDKISKKAKIAKVEPMEIAQKYTVGFREVLGIFNTLPPSIEPTATGHIIEQIELVKAMLANGSAYEVDGSVYFDVEKYNQKYDYGILSGRNLEDMLNNTRSLGGQDEKHGKLDFALWIKAKPEHLMKWPSPWGLGFPGWHLECSAMSHKYLGDQFDIHGGGMDLQFPHHESEIAQSTVCYHKNPARYWIHNNMITINGKKMGKAYGNTITLTELFSGENVQLEKAYHPMVIRFFILQTHYHSTLDFSNEALQAAEKGLKRLWDAYENLQKIDTIDLKPTVDEELNKKVIKLLAELDEFMNDDFNTARVLANMFELAPVINGIKDKIIPVSALPAETYAFLNSQFKLYLEDILGLKSITESDNNKLKGVMDLLIEIRKEAKTKKDFATSDRIRNHFAGLGINLKDEKGGGMSWNIELPHFRCSQHFPFSRRSWDFFYTKACCLHSTAHVSF